MQIQAQEERHELSQHIEDLIPLVTIQVSMLDVPDAEGNVDVS